MSFSNFLFKNVHLTSIWCISRSNVVANVSSTLMEMNFTIGAKVWWKSRPLVWENPCVNNLAWYLLTSPFVFLFIGKAHLLLTTYLPSFQWLNDIVILIFHKCTILFVCNFFPFIHISSFESFMPCQWFIHNNNACIIM